MEPRFRGGGGGRGLGPGELLLLGGRKLRHGGCQVRLGADGRVVDGVGDGAGLGLSSLVASLMIPLLSLFMVSLLSLFMVSLPSLFMASGLISLLVLIS